MPYSKQTWEDDNLSYPVSAERMSHIEDGIYDARGVADEALSSATTAVGALGGLESDIDDLYDALGTQQVVIRGDGIDPTGNTDSTAAIQDLLNSTPPGGVCFFPPGEYLAHNLAIPSGVTVMGYGAVINVVPEGNAAGFVLEPGTSDVTLQGLDIRGPWYGIDTSSFAGGIDLPTWYEVYAENIGIDIRGRWYQREVLGISYPEMQALSDTHRNVKIFNCNIEGFGQSAILADQVTDLTIQNCNLYRCGRDGIRLYGTVRGKVTGNTVGDLFPAYPDGAPPNYNMYGIACTRLYGKTGYADPDLSIGRPSTDIIVSNNHIFSCPTWKGLDTHGGQRIRFNDNIVEDCFIGIGIDKGGINSTNGIAPARDILVSGNLIRSTSAAKYVRAGVAAYGHDDTDTHILDGLVITGNTFVATGGNDTDAALSASNVRGLTVTGNTFRNNPRAAVTFFGTVRDFTVTGNTFDNPRGYVTVPVSSGGSGYTSPPSVLFTGGGGAGLKAVARISGGEVTRVEIIHPGTGYTSPPSVTLTGGGGSGATVSPTFTPGYGVLCSTTTARGVIDANTFTNRSQTTITAISLQNRATSYGVQIGKDNLFSGTMVKVNNPAAEDGGSWSTATRAWGNVNNDGIAGLSAGRGVASVTRTGVGAVTVALADAASASNSYSVSVIGKGVTPRQCTVNAVDSSSFSVRTFDASGAPVDSGFYFTVTCY